MKLKCLIVKTYEEFEELSNKNHLGFSETLLIFFANVHLFRTLIDCRQNLFKLSNNMVKNEDVQIVEPEILIN